MLNPPHSSTPTPTKSIPLIDRILIIGYLDDDIKATICNKAMKIEPRILEEYKSSGLQEADIKTTNENYLNNISVVRLYTIYYLLYNIVLHA